MRFYVQRAKCGQGNHPVRLKYETEESFLQSLFVLDYSYLLSNEPFFVGIENSETKDFSVRTATFGGLAVAYGAASMFIEQIFSLPNLMHPEKNGSYLLEYLDFMSMKQRKSKMSCFLVIKDF